jgi:hypothetical protein
MLYQYLLPYCVSTAICSSPEIPTVYMTMTLYFRAFCFGTANEIKRFTFCTPLLFEHVQTVHW